MRKQFDEDILLDGRALSHSQQKKQTTLTYTAFTTLE